MRASEGCVEYRQRLRVLCEDFALVGRPRSIKEMFNLWLKGLRCTMWREVAIGIRRDIIRRANWTDMEVIYAIERIMMYAHGTPMLQEATFILRNEGHPTFPDFRTWNAIGPLFVYAHDELTDHDAWLQADYDAYFHWYGMYRNILFHPHDPPPFPQAQEHWPYIIGDEEPMMREGENNMDVENDQMEENIEEEDPEKDIGEEGMERENELWSDSDVGLGHFTPTPNREEASNQIPHLSPSPAQGPPSFTGMNTTNPITTLDAEEVREDYEARVKRQAREVGEGLRRVKNMLEISTQREEDWPSQSEIEARYQGKRRMSVRQYLSQIWGKKSRGSSNQDPREQP